MMKNRFSKLVSASLLLASPAFSQNHVQHIDGIIESSVVRPFGTATGTVFQRFPHDQTRCRKALYEIRVVVHDADASTVETATVEVRTALASGAPDLSITGLVAGPLQFKDVAGTGVVTTTHEIPFGCIPLPPTGDLWVGVTLPANSSWSTDGLSVLASEGEEHKAIGGNGYSGAAFDEAGLSWATGSGFLPLAWDISLGLCEDVTQPVASHPSRFVTGLEPNYGYAGIFPDTTAGPVDAIGFRLRSSAPAGNPAVLLLNVVPVGPFGPGWPFIGCLCVTPAASVIGVTGPPADPELATSEVTFPLGKSVDFGNTVNLLGQCVTINGGLIQLSTASRISL